MTFADRLQQAMKNLPPIPPTQGRGRKPSQIGQLAKLSEIHYKDVHRIVAYGVRPGKKRVERIAKACGVNPKWLFYGLE